MSLKSLKLKQKANSLQSKLKGINYRNSKQSIPEDVENYLVDNIHRFQITVLGHLSKSLTYAWIDKNKETIWVIKYDFDSYYAKDTLDKYGCYSLNIIPFNEFEVPELLFKNNQDYQYYYKYSYTWFNHGKRYVSYKLFNAMNNRKFSSYTHLDYGTWEKFLQEQYGVPKSEQPQTNTKTWWKLWN